MGENSCEYSVLKQPKSRICPQEISTLVKIKTSMVWS